MAEIGYALGSSIDYSRFITSLTIFSPAVSPKRPSDSPRSHLTPFTTSSHPIFGCVAQPYFNTTDYPILPPSPSSPDLLPSTTGTTLPQQVLFSYEDEQDLPLLSPTTTLVERSFSTTHSRRSSISIIQPASKRQRRSNHSMTPTFDFNAFINSTSSPSSPDVQPQQQQQQGGSQLEVDSKTGAAGTAREDQHNNNNNNSSATKGEDDGSLLPAWATATEHCTAPIQRSIAGQHSRPASSTRGSMDAMLFSHPQQQQQQQQQETPAFYNPAGGAGMTDMDMIQALGIGAVNHAPWVPQQDGQQQHWANALQQQQGGPNGFAPPLQTAPLPQVQHQHQAPPMHPMHSQQQQQFHQQQQHAHPGLMPSYYSSGAINMPPTPITPVVRAPMASTPLVPTLLPQQQQAAGVVNEAQVQAAKDYRARITEHHSRFLHTSGGGDEEEPKQPEGKKRKSSSSSAAAAAHQIDGAFPAALSPSTKNNKSLKKPSSGSKKQQQTSNSNDSSNSQDERAAAAEVAAARESVAARVMSWAAGTGGPSAGSGGSGGEEATPNLVGKNPTVPSAVAGDGNSSGGPSTAAAAAVAQNQNGGGGSGGLTRASRLSLQERRRLSRLASEAAGSDSGSGSGSGSGANGKNPSRSQSLQSQSEASGQGVTTKKDLPEDGGVAGGPTVNTTVPFQSATHDSAVTTKPRTMPERTKRALAAGQAAANAAAEQDSHSSNYNGGKSKSASSGDDEEGASKSVSAAASSARAVRESSGEGATTDTDPVFHGPYHDIAITANGKDGPKHVRNSYSSSGFDILGALSKVAMRKNPRIQLGPIDLSCAFTVSDALKPEQPLIYVSETFTKLTGYTSADVLGKNCRFLQAPDGNMAKGAERLNTDGRAVSHMKKHIDRMRECQASLINYKKNGKAFINLVTIVPIPWGDSNVVQYYVGFQVDLVEQPGAILEKDSNGQYVVNYTTASGANRRSVIPIPPPLAPDPIQEALEEKTRQVNGAHKLAEIVASGQADVRPWARLLLDNAQDLIYVLSLKGIFLYVSPSVERILGYKAEELIGRSISDFCHPSDVVPVFRELKDSTSNASIAAAARKSARAVGGYKALTKGGAGQSGPQVNLLLRMRHKHLGHQWIESVGKLHLEQGKGRKVVISSGRPRTVYNLSWDQVRRTTDDREPAFWSKVSLDGLVLSSTSRTAAVLGCTPAMLQGQHLMEMCNGEAAPAIVQALRSNSVSMVSHMLHDTVGQGEPVPVISTFYPSVEQALAFGGESAVGLRTETNPTSDELATDEKMADLDGGNTKTGGHAPPRQFTRGSPVRDSTASVFVHIRRATAEMPLEANIAYMDELQMLKMQAQLQPGVLQSLPSLKASLNQAAAAAVAANPKKSQQQQHRQHSPLAASDILADPAAVAAAAAAAAADLGGSGSVFTELSTYRSSSWVFELHQLKIMNKKLREEVKTAQRQGRLSGGGAPVANGGSTAAAVTATTPATGLVSTPAPPSSQQMLAHQQQLAAQTQAIVHHPSHMNSIVGSLNGSNSSFMGVPMAIAASNHSSTAGPTAQSPTSSRVLPPAGMGMSGHANALAAAGLRRPGIIPMQQPGMHQHQVQHGGGSFASQMGSFQQQQQQQQHAYSMQMGMHPLTRDGSMGASSLVDFNGGGGSGVPMDVSSSSGPGSMSTTSLFDVYPQQHQHHHPNSTHLHPHSHSHRVILSGGSNSDSSGAIASGETSTSATSLEVSSNGEDSVPGSRSGSGSAGGDESGKERHHHHQRPHHKHDHRSASSSAEETMKEHKRRVDASTAVLSKAAAAAAIQQQQRLHPSGIGGFVAGRKRSAAGDILP
ncbi:hypothetical protein CF327_g2868 [Tilletia walkeri]|nr:hypothetical protein CF327_g2868 [Tilletia walkeri]